MPDDSVPPAEEDASSLNWERFTKSGCYDSIVRMLLKSGDLEQEHQKPSDVFSAVVSVKNGNKHFASKWREERTKTEALTKERDTYRAAVLLFAKTYGHPNDPLLSAAVTLAAMDEEAAG